MQNKQTRTFVVQIKSDENNTWQGTCEFMEDKKRVPFRSGLELIRLMDSAIGKEEAVNEG